MGEGTVSDSGTYATQGLRKRGAVVNSAMASTEPGSAVSGAAMAGAAVSGAAMPGSAESGAAVSGAALPGAALSDAAMPDAAVSGAALSDAAVSGAGSNPCPRASVEQAAANKMKKNETAGFIGSLFLVSVQPVH